LSEATAVAPRLSVRQILHPASVAVFGASESRDKFGGRIIYFLTRHGYAGRIVPINPRRGEIRGHRAYASLTEVVEPVEVAILAVSPDHLVAAITECAATGVGCCVIITTGFAEADEAGAALQQQILDIARPVGMRIVGPNCMGLLNPLHAMALCSSVVLDVDRLLTGRLGLISQSGALMVSLFDRAYAEDIGFSSCVSLGNQPDLEICDFLEYLIDDPETDAIALYVEGFRDGARFIELAARSAAKGKPIVALKTGKTSAGVRAAQSHTASLAGSYDAFAASCAANGVVLVEDPVTLIRVADMLAKGPKPQGDGIGVLSGSGGGAGVVVDRIGTMGLRVAQLSEATRTVLRGMLLPPQADNPVDLGGRLPGQADDISATALATLAADPDVSVLLLYLTSMPFFEQRTRTLAEAARATGKTVVAFMLPGPAGDGPRRILREIGIPTFDSTDDLLSTVKAVLTHRTLMADIEPIPNRPFGLPLALPAFTADADGLAGLVAAYGIRFPAAQNTADPHEAAIAADGIGYPVVLKGNVTGVTHKTDMGLVKPGISDAQSLARAWQAIVASCTAHGVADRFTGCLVQQQIQEGLELIIAIRQDPQFGPQILAGSGGVLVELLKDVALAPAPLSPTAARRLLGKLRSAALFGGVRGAAPRDIDAAADALVRLSWLAHDLGSALTDLEINPLIVGSAGAGAFAVDLRATLDDGDMA
jgi:acyl-CoA synthetase (NDP forming)